MTAEKTFACCACCDNGVDPDLHAENGRDFHDVECTLCNRPAGSRSDYLDTRREAFISGFYSARRHPDIAAATHAPDFPGGSDGRTV